LVGDRVGVEVGSGVLVGAAEGLSDGRGAAVKVGEGLVGDEVGEGGSDLLVGVSIVPV